MSWQAAFGMTNAVMLAGWLVLIAAPRGAVTRRLVLYGAIGLLCAAYAAMFAALAGGLVDPGRLPGAPPPNVRDYTIPGLRALFLSDGGLVMGWTHYLALDLLAGWWIGGDADKRGWSRLAQLPFLIVTLMAGPLGLLAWLAVSRARR